MSREYYLSEDESLTRYEIKKKLKRIFPNHIGEANSINYIDLFIQVFGIHPTEQLNPYKAKFFWDVIKGQMKELRREQEIFIILKRTKAFVLKSQEECNKFKKMIDTDIKNLNRSKENATKWIKEEKWRYI